MMRGKCAKWVVLGLGLGVLLWNAACGGTRTYPIVITISPTTAYVPTGSALLFSTTVSGTPNSLVVWTVGPDVGGNPTQGFISTNGYYQAPGTIPTPSQVTVRVTSQKDGTKFATATVTIVSQSSGANSVAVSSGQTVSNINIGVLPLTPALTVYGLGSCAGSACSTTATGLQVAQGGSTTVYLVGAGVVSGTVVSVSGKPTDVMVVQPSPDQFGQTSNGTPSVSFDITVSANAAVGPRNVMVANPATGELSAFVGGLLITASGQ
jgi:hypothetical protein